MQPLAPQDRYLFKPFYGSSHWWALSELESLPATTSVLDIGAGSGAIGRELASRGWTEIFAVEIDPAAQDHIRSIYREVHPSLEGYKGRKFDLILLLDVIEHVPNCEQFLRDAIAMLNPGGTVLASVPNFAHWSVRLPLLFGELPLASRGILDRTHVQLFTRRRFLNLLIAAGLRIERAGASIPPAEFALPKALWDNGLFRSLSKLRHAIAEMFPGLFGYQHLVRARWDSNTTKQ